MKEATEQVSKNKKKRQKRRKKQKMIVSHSLFTMTSENLVVVEEIKGENKSSSKSSSKENQLSCINLKTDIEKAQLNDKIQSIQNNDICAMMNISNNSNKKQVYDQDS
jgi:hypothetical protein